MILKQRLFSNMFLRNMVADLFGRTAYSKTPGTFIPYFQYKVVTYQPDHYLYFPKEPYTRRYHNEIFNKLYEYKGFDIITYLEFHYSAYSEKQHFLRFLQYEISDRLKQKPKESYRQKLQSAREWVTEKQQEMQQSQHAALQLEIEQGVRQIFSGTPKPNNHNGVETATHTLVQNIGTHVKQIMNSMEERMENLSSAFVTGNIEIYNQKHEEKLIQLFKMLQTVQAPPQKTRAEQVFKKFSDTDIASILRLHFAPFKNKKINTLQVNIRETNERMNDKNPKVKKLEEALQEFFY